MTVTDRLLNDPHAVYRELNWVLGRCNARDHSWRYDDRGIDVVAEDWDVLVLLDSCRADVFESVNWIGGDFSVRRSPASHSRSFLKRTFGNRKCHDTVYVTANPHAPVLDPDTFHDVVPLFERSFEVGAVPPCVVAEHAREAADEYPNKRLIVHFMQPHHPYVGEFGQSIMDGVVSWRGLIFPRDISRETLRKAYRENLELVLEHVERLAGEIDGKIIVSADHGELLGERQFPIPIRGYEHERGLHHPKLRKVPWLEIPARTRRTISSDPPREKTEYDSDRVEESLHALGYTA